MTRPWPRKWKRVIGKVSRLLDDDFWAQHWRTLSIFVVFRGFSCMLFYGGWIVWYFTSHSCGKSVARVMRHSIILYDCSKKYSSWLSAFEKLSEQCIVIDTYYGNIRKLCIGVLSRKHELGAKSKVTISSDVSFVTRDNHRYNAILRVSTSSTSGSCKQGAMNLWDIIVEYNIFRGHPAQLTSLNGVLFRGIDTLWREK